MIIKIETNCEEDIEKVKYYISNFCKENFRDAKIFINDKLEDEFNWRSENGK
jgi:hypothetical protein